MADDQLAKSSRAYNFGQNANKLHARPEGSKSSKAWRAEVPATDDEKLTARQFVDDFSSKFRLDGVHMSAIVEQHVTMLEVRTLPLYPSATLMMVAPSSLCSRIWVL